jgi:hypothetical protein
MADEGMQAAAVVAFYWAIDCPDGTKRSFNLNVGIPGGDFRSVIKAVREEGGHAVQDEDDRIWFLPWPPTFIEIKRPDL